MLSTRSYTTDRLDYSSEDDDHLDDDRDRGCYVVWKSTSVLEAYPSLLPPPALHRSGAPEPSLATGTTPRTKRTTTNAALPSPSAVLGDEAESPEGLPGTSSTSSSTRQAKKRRNFSSRRAAVAARQAMATAAAEPLDAKTLELVTQLGRKIQARTAAITTPRQSSAGLRATPSGSGGATSASGSRDLGKNGTSAKNGTAVAPSRSPLRQSLLSTNATTARGSTPLRQTPARMARQQQQTLSLSATKANLFATKPGPNYRSKTSVAVPEAKVNSPEVLVPPTPTCRSNTLASAGHEARDVGVAAQSRHLAVAVEDEVDYFGGDESFELALSQLDEASLVPSQPAALAARPPSQTRPVPTSRSPVVSNVAGRENRVIGAVTKNSVRTATAARSVRAPSPRVKGSTVSTTHPVRPFTERTGSAGSIAVAAGHAVAQSKPSAAPPTRLPTADARSLHNIRRTEPTFTAIAKPAHPRADYKSGPPPPKTAATIVVRTSGSSRLQTSAASGNHRLAMEELARKEIEALERMGEEEGFMLWDDDDF